MDNQGSIPKFNRPGVSDKFLHDHGIRNVGKEDARGLCSTVDPGVWIPYKDYEGIDVEDGDLPFGRLRRSEPGEKPRYHQKGKTGVHAYFPKPTIELESSDTMILIEGEFKALCLAEHGFPVIGLPGIGDTVAKTLRVSSSWTQG
jgi:hypothetical protein